MGCTLTTPPPLVQSEPIRIHHKVTQHQSNLSPFSEFIVASFWWIVAVASLIKIVSYFIIPPGNATAGYHIGKLLVGFICYGGILSLIAFIISLFMRGKQNVFRIVFTILYSLACLLTLPSAILKAKVNSDVRDLMLKQASESQKVLEYPNGGRYEGDVVNGNRHGRGTMKARDGSSYTGEWLDDIICGNGTVIYASGGSYFGEWANNKYHGLGTEISADGSKYTGGWHNGIRQGKGKLTYADGSIYTGDFLDGKPSGRGRLTKSDGEVEDGLWQDGVFKLPSDLFEGSRTR